MNDGPIVRRISFDIHGEFITQLAREWFYTGEKSHEKVIEILMDSMTGTDTPEAQIRRYAEDILLGRAALKGSTAAGTYHLETYEPGEEEQMPQSMNIWKEVERRKKAEKDLRRMIERWDVAMDHISESTQREIRKELGEETAEDRQQDALDGFMKRMMDEEDHTTEDYGWLEPDGTFHGVGWGDHQEWANNYLEEKLTEEPAAEQKASSASESQPASEETKPEEPASSSKQSQEEAASLQEEITEINWVEETVKSKYCSNSVSVRYSIGAKSIQLLYDGEPKTYHLSAPLQSVQRVKKGDYEHFVFYVPEGTTVTADWSGVDGAMLRWIEVSHIFSEDELQNVNDSDVQMETSMTVRKNIMYQQVQEWDYVTHFSWVSDDGGIIFCAE